jgi:hypothetical protein
LDRVVPGWECPAKELSTPQAAIFKNTIKNDFDLDELEKELGLDNDQDFNSTWNNSNSKSLIESAPPSAGKHNNAFGCIPTHWIVGCFTGAIPPSHSACLLDWAILNGERFAGN